MNLLGVLQQLFCRFELGLFGEFLGECGVAFRFIKILSSISGLGLEIINFGLSKKVRGVDFGLGLFGRKEGGLGVAHFLLRARGGETTRRYSY